MIYISREVCPNKQNNVYVNLLFGAQKIYKEVKPYIYIQNHKMPDYKKAKIYAIRSHQTNEIYIGATTQTLAVRLAGHRRKLKHYNKGKLRFVTSFKILEHKDAYIELLCECPCDNVEQLRKVEGKYIREMKCVNKCIPDRTRKEYANTKVNCECGGKYTMCHRALHFRTKKHQKYLQIQKI